MNRMISLFALLALGSIPIIYFANKPPVSDGPAQYPVGLEVLGRATDDLLKGPPPEIPICTEGHEEFCHPTVELHSKKYLIPAGQNVCLDIEQVDQVPFALRKCHKLAKALKVRVAAVIYGITQPEFYVEPVDGHSAKGWVYRASIEKSANE